jgi:hypothetical protein
LFHPFQAHLCLLGWNMASWSHGSGRLKYMLLCRQANFWSIHFPLFTVPFRTGCLLMIASHISEISHSYLPENGHICSLLTLHYIPSFLL